jgi:Phage baseplate assembly protein W
VHAALDAWWDARQSERDEILDTNGITALWWSYALAGDGIVQNEAELDQTLKIILTTPYGADIHRPDFASNVWQYIDYPIPQATPNVVRETTVAIAKWEPRVTLRGVAVEPYSPGMAGLTVTANWAIGNFEGSTTLALSR